MENGPSPTHIELVWPGKYASQRPEQASDGVWELAPAPEGKRRFPIVELQPFGDEAGYASNLVLQGDRLIALETLSRHYGRTIKLAYLDPPRIEIDDKTAAFQGDTSARYTTWLSTIRAHLQALTPLLSRDGFVAIQVADAEEPYARLVADEVFGRDNHVGTVVWQRSYAPRNPMVTKEFTANHECILAYAFDKAYVDAVGLRLAPEGYKNPDGDPRQEWKAEHKGAASRRETTDYDTFVAPYRWKILNGELPPGIWRLSPLTGVIWGTPEVVGKFPIEVQVSDSEGKTATSRITIEVADFGDSSYPTEVPWLFEQIEPKGKLRITTTEPGPIIAGQPSSILLLAGGGKPFTDSPKRPGKGRYWEYANYTLLKAYLEDRVDLGQKGNKIPAIKSYRNRLESDVVVRNQMTWWPGRKENEVAAGYTQDATKHLKKLNELGLIKAAPKTAKPEMLLDRLLSIFTEPGDVVLECFVSTGDMAAVAMKRSRRFVHLQGESIRDVELLHDCVIPRLEAVAKGADNDLEGVGADTYIPFGGSGGFVFALIGPWLFEKRPSEDIAILNLEDYAEPKNFVQALMTAEGYFPIDGARGVSPDGSRRCVVIDPDSYLTEQLAAEIASNPSGVRTTVYYFMASEDFDPELVADGVSYRRVPMELVF